MQIWQRVKLFGIFFIVQIIFVGYLGASEDGVYAVRGPVSKFIEDISPGILKTDSFFITGKINHAVPVTHNGKPSAYLELKVKLLNPQSRGGVATRSRLALNESGFMRHLEGNSKGWRDFAIPFFYNAIREEPESISLICHLETEGEVKIKDVRLVDGKNIGKWAEYGLIPVAGWWKPGQTLKYSTYIVLIFAVLGLCLIVFIIISYLFNDMKYVNLAFLFMLLVSVFLICLSLVGWLQEEQPWWVYVTLMFFGVGAFLVSVVAWYAVNVSIFKGNLFRVESGDDSENASIVVMDS